MKLFKASGLLLSSGLLLQGIVISHHSYLGRSIGDFLIKMMTLLQQFSWPREEWPFIPQLNFISIVLLGPIALNSFSIRFEDMVVVKSECIILTLILSLYIIAVSACMRLNLVNLARCFWPLIFFCKPYAILGQELLAAVPSISKQNYGKVIISRVICFFTSLLFYFGLIDILLAFTWGNHHHRWWKAFGKGWILAGFQC